MFRDSYLAVRCGVVGNRAKTQRHLECPRTTELLKYGVKNNEINICVLTGKDLEEILMREKNEVTKYYTMLDSVYGKEHMYQYRSVSKILREGIPSQVTVVPSWK